MNKRTKNITIASFLTLGLATAAWQAQRVYAEFGIPSPSALSYKGTLQSGTAPYDGVADFDIRLFTSPGLEQELCHVAAGATPVAGGRFEVELSDACTTAVENNDETWILVTVDVGGGPESFPVERLHASAYAVSAKKADTAHNGVPVGGILWWTQPGGAAVPDGFQLCDGGVINSGPMAGSNTPNLIGRFARGATSTNLQAVGGQPTSTNAVGDHAHMLFFYEDSTNAWFGSKGNGFEVIRDYQDGLGVEGSGVFPITVLDGQGDQILFSDQDGAHSHAVAEPVPAHVPLLPLIRIR